MQGATWSSGVGGVEIERRIMDTRNAAGAVRLRDSLRFRGDGINLLAGPDAPLGPSQHGFRTSDRLAGSSIPHKPLTLPIV